MGVPGREECVGLVDYSAGVFLSRMCLSVGIDLEGRRWSRNGRLIPLGRFDRFLCVRPPEKQWYFSPRNTCILEGTCSGISLRIITHVPLGFFVCLQRHLYDGHFDVRLINRPDFFRSTAGLFFYGMADLSKQYRPAHQETCT